MAIIQDNVPESHCKKQGKKFSYQIAWNAKLSKYKASLVVTLFSVQLKYFTLFVDFSFIILLKNLTSHKQTVTKLLTAIFTLAKLARGAYFVFVGVEKKNLLHSFHLSIQSISKSCASLSDNQCSMQENAPWGDWVHNEVLSCKKQTVIFFQVHSRAKWGQPVKTWFNNCCCLVNPKRIKLIKKSDTADNIPEVKSRFEVSRYATTETRHSNNLLMENQIRFRIDINHLSKWNSARISEESDLKCLQHYWYYEL